MNSNPKSPKGTLRWFAIGSGAYEERKGGKTGKSTGRFAERPRGKTWRILRGIDNRKEARLTALSRNPHTRGLRFAIVGKNYTAADCPDSNNRPRPEKYCLEEKARVLKLIEFFGADEIEELSHADWPRYAQWRIADIQKRLPNVSGLRAVDKDHQTISNIFQYAVVNKLLKLNPFAARYTHYQRPELIKHSRTRAPKTAEHVHQVAAHLLEKITTETAGWWTLFATFSFGRISEILRFRRDAKQLSLDPPKFEPGYIHTMPGQAENEAPRQFMQFGRRDKHGINPRVLIGPEFSDMLAAFENWHRQRWPGCEWYFPNERGNAAIDRWTVRRQIARACKRLGLHDITPHGYRSFAATKRRSDGEQDSRIAFELGQRTVAVLQNHYADGPDNWMGGKKIGWLPEKGDPAWAIWSPPKRVKPQKVDFLLTETKSAASETANRIKPAGVAKWQTHRT